jgi:catalase
MWLMSDRAIPRSYRMMEGFGVHSFKFINSEGDSHFVKFHFKPKLGVHSVAWDEAQKISGKDPDFHRRSLGSYRKWCFPEWDFGVQLIPEENENDFDFDLLDPTKIVPEELVPVQIIGTLTLIKIRIIFLLKQSRWLSIRDIWFRESISVMIHYYRVGYFLIPILSYHD